MAFIPTPLTARLAAEFDYVGQECVMTFWFEAEVAFDVASLTNLAAALVDWAAAHLMPNLSTLLSLTGVRATAQDSATAPSILYTTGLPMPGVIGGAAGAPQVAAVASLRTDLRGRSFRGRNYIPGIPASFCDDVGTLSVAGAATYASVYADLDEVEAAADVTHVVVSHYADHLARVAGVTTPISAYVVDQPLDTQRRRSVGRGA